MLKDSASVRVGSGLVCAGPKLLDGFSKVETAAEIGGVRSDEENFLTRGLRDGGAFKVDTGCNVRGAPPEETRGSQPEYQGETGGDLAALVRGRDGSESSLCHPKARSLPDWKAGEIPGSRAGLQRRRANEPH